MARFLHEDTPSGAEDPTGPLLVFTSREHAMEWARESRAVEDWGDRLVVVALTVRECVPTCIPATESEA